MADLGILADLDGLAVAALIGAMIGMAIAIGLAGMVAGLAVERWWTSRRSAFSKSSARSFTGAAEPD